jgi:predicted Ser/Thr protein kinase
MTPIPPRIGRYEIRERLAQGGMGMLYLGFDPVTDRYVALKVLRVDSEDMRERFLREARLAARLQHPNIVTVYDVGSHEGQPFIAMEFIAGETLAQIVARRVPLPIARIVALVQEICQGLAYAHRHGIVHRDIKPANLMISRDSGVLKVLDFGVAGRMDAQGHATMLMGTPNYMSPEQIVGYQIDQRSDIFSVGLVLYELISCRRAFTGDSQQAILLKVLHESPEPLSSLVSGLDPAIPAIVNRALEKSLDARYADLDAMRSDLSRVAQRIEIGEAARIASYQKAQRSLARRLQQKQTESAVAPAPAPTPRRDDADRVHDLLAAAEREAYEGRLTTAIRKLEQGGVTHPDLDAALQRYRAAATEALEKRREAEDAANRSFAESLRSHIGSVRSAIASGRWSEASDLIVALERRLPVVEGEAVQPADPPALVLSAEDEVAHYLTRARQRLDSGDVDSALTLMDAALRAARVVPPAVEDKDNPPPPEEM